MSSTVSLRQIALACGLGKPTVSMALRNSPDLRLATREKVWIAAQELGYQPDPEVTKLMAHLRRRRRVESSQEVLGLLTAWDVPSPWKIPNMRHIQAFYKTITTRAADLGYRVDEFWVREPGMSPKRLVQILQTRSVRGLLFCPGGDFDRHLSMDLSWFACAACTSQIWRPRLPRVESAQFHNTMLALRELYKRGYRRIGFVQTGNQAQDQGYIGIGAYFAFHARFPDTAPLPPLALPDWDERGFGPWFHEHQPEAILGPEYSLTWLEKAGLRVPDDVAFISLGVLPDSPVSGVNSRSTAVDAAMVDLVAQQLQNNEFGVPEAPKIVTVEGVWQEGTKPSLKKKFVSTYRPPANPPPTSTHIATGTQAPPPSTAPSRPPSPRPKAAAKTRLATARMK